MNGTSAVTFILAFVFVLALIGLAAWLVRRFGGNRLGANSARGRMPRLAVIDAAAVDGRRRLVLVRRDNVEHLIMIGGPSDIVVEPNIVRAAPGREREPVNQRDASRAPSFADTPSWAPPEPAELGTEPEAAPEPPAPTRPARPAFVEEPRRPAAAALPERRPEPTVAAVTPEPTPAPVPPREPLLRASRTETPRSEMPRSEPMMPRPMRADPPIRTMPPTRPLERANIPAAPAGAAKPEAPAIVAPSITSTTPSTPAAISAADQNLADMAQRLEAALRRPSGEPARSDAPEPRIGAPSVAPDTPAAASRPRAPEVSIASASRGEAPAVTPPAKSGFENLEDEMASLLGRPKSSS
ncbi:flagellar biosynthesis protein FliO [Rhodopseudomonas boonkerdii]|uniref:flagellar biosynthetic protein FliO n=1 Tax=Rhodopseudomonas boonkerdii TaxID=475937 RepID=UPI001E456AF0|nr:flagellar biosynthetic protein FliO [Rhodopseudomonas boonkerdii]UGV27474.1 flagellar biosynthesis protein FliO [Rhodopseudomonas boonkerdii]